MRDKDDALALGFDLYPPYVTEDDRERWDLCVEIATAVSERYEKSGVADTIFVWTTTRALFHDRSIPTGSPEDAHSTDRANPEHGSSDL